jgi:hypothetical protein
MPTTVPLSLPFAAATLPPAYSQNQNTSTNGKYASVPPKPSKIPRSLKQVDTNAKIVGHSSFKSRNKKSFTKSTPTTSIGESRQQSQQWVILLAGTGMVAYASFLVTVLPAAALMASAIIVSVLCLLCYILYLQFRRELQHLLSTRGIGDFLPSEVFYTLTQQSLDEFLTDPTKIFLTIVKCITTSLFGSTGTPSSGKLAATRLGLVSGTRLDASAFG